MVMTYGTSPSPVELRELSTTELGSILLSNLGNQRNVHNMMIGHRQAHEKIASANDLIGVPLARRVLHPRSGSLTDTRLEKGERQAVADLFAGALGAFKDPASHRVVDFDDPARAADAIVVADLLLRMLDGSADSDTISEEDSGGRS